MKVFFDTNVWLSAIVFPGLCAELLAALAETEYELLSSELVRAETHAVLQRKFAQHEQAVMLFDLLWGSVRCVADVDEPADDADARLVTAAAQAGADLFVTGDQRLLGWGARGTLGIVSPRKAWTMLFSPDT